MCRHYVYNRSQWHNATDNSDSVLCTGLITGYSGFFRLSIFISFRQNLVDLVPILTRSNSIIVDCCIAIVTSDRIGGAWRLRMFHNSCINKMQFVPPCIRP